MIALITGASGGLGRAMATECAGRGYDLFLTDINELSLGQIKKGIMRQYDVNVLTKACDLTNEKAVGDLFNTIKEQGIKLNMFLAVAGLDFEGGFLDRECSKIIDIINLNIAATLRTTHLALSSRDKEQRFDLVIVSSLASQYPMPLKATYAASKRFLLDFSIALRQEQKKHNVNIMALCPSGLATTRDAMDGIMAQGFLARVSTVNLPTVASKTISKVQKGKGVYIPGVFNRILSALGKIVPRNIIAKMLYNRWESAQQKWLEIDA